MPRPDVVPSTTTVSPSSETARGCQGVRVDRKGIPVQWVIASRHRDNDRSYSGAGRWGTTGLVDALATRHRTRLAPAPCPGPITVFVHHNTLHAFEELTFHEAVQKASKIFDCQPYLSEDRYQQELARGRILVDDLTAVLREELGAAADERILAFGTRLDLRLAMLKYPIRQAPDAELRWFVAETDALTRYRADVPPAARDRFLEETRHWVMRDLRGGPGTRAGQGIG